MLPPSADTLARTTSLRESSPSCDTHDVAPDAGTGRNWIPGRGTAAELAKDTKLPPLTRSSLIIAAGIASVLGGYLGR